MSKGSNQRPPAISQEELDVKWERTFGGKRAPTRVEERGTEIEEKAVRTIPGPDSVGIAFRFR